MLERLLTRPARCAVVALSFALAGAGGAVAAERPALGAPTPGFVLPATDGTTVDLATLRGHQRAVVVFFRGSW